MADLFGRNPQDYAIVRDLQAAGLWERHQAGNAARFQSANPIHNFDALGHGPPKRFERSTDQQMAVGFLTDNMLALSTQADEQLYTAYRLDDFLAMDESVPEGAMTRGRRVRQRAGRAARISAPGFEAPSATASQTRIVQEVHYYGLDAEWSIDELRGAMFDGFPLDSESIDAALSGTMDEMEAVGLTGADYPDTTGLLNHAITGDGAVQHQTADATFENMNAVEIRSLINKELSTCINDSKETLGRNLVTGMTVYLPGPQYDLLTDMYIGDNAEKTLMASIIEDNPWTHFTRTVGTAGEPLMIKRVLELENIEPVPGMGNETDRMVVALKHERVANMGVAIRPRVLGIIEKGRVICAQVEAKFTDTWMIRPKTVRYTDDI